MLAANSAHRALAQGSREIRALAVAFNAFAEAHSAQAREVEALRDAA